MTFREEDHPRDENGRFTDGKVESSADRLKRVWEKHFPHLRVDKTIDDALSLTEKEKHDTISIEIDELVPCLRDATTGRLVETEVAEIPRSRLTGYNKKSGWEVNWSQRPKDEKVFGVYLKGDTSPQGLIAMGLKKHSIYIGFMSVSPENNKQYTKNPRYSGIGGHLFALAVEESIKSGKGGVVEGLAANEQLLKHYHDKFGAERIGIIHPYHFIIEGEASINLIKKYNYTRRE